MITAHVATFDPFEGIDDDLKGLGFAAGQRGPGISPARMRALLARWQRSARRTEYEKLLGLKRAAEQDAAEIKKYLEFLAQIAIVVEQQNKEEQALHQAQPADVQAGKLGIASLTLTPRLLAQRPITARAARACLLI